MSWRKCRVKLGVGMLPMRQMKALQGVSLRYPGAFSTLPLWIKKASFCVIPEGHSGGPPVFSGYPGRFIFLSHPPETRTHHRYSLTYQDEALGTTAWDREEPIKQSAKSTPQRGSSTEGGPLTLAVEPSELRKQVALLTILAST